MTLEEKLNIRFDNATLATYASYDRMPGKESFRREEDMDKGNKYEMRGDTIRINEWYL